MHLEHIGIAVTDTSATLDLYERLLGARAYKRERVESEGVLTTFLDAGGPRLELLEATRADSPIARHLAARGEGLHHLAFEVPDVDAAHARLAAAGFRLLNPAPKRGADDKRIFFIHPKDTNGVLIELCGTSPLPLDPDMAPAGNERVAFYDGGNPQAPALVLLHGAMGSVELEMRPLLAALEPHFRTIAVDLAGHGRSSDFAEADPIPLELFRDNVLTVMDHLGVGTAHVFGFSLGAAVGLLLAHSQRARVARLAVLGANVQWTEDEARAMIAAINPAAVAERPRWAARFAETHGEPRWRVLASRVMRFTERLPQHHFPDDALSRIDTPTLVAHGDRDRFFRLEHALHLQRTLPDARLAVLPNQDHPLHHLDAPLFARMLRSHLLR